jgi:DNA-binding transcriptional MerR regulator
MSDQSALQTPQAVTQVLDISPATLRRWADEFTDYLSPAADSGQGKSHRRYTNQDIQVLRVVKELMGSGQTYEQVRQQLAAADTDPVGGFPPAPEAGPFETRGSSALVAANSGESPAITFLTNTLATLSDTQQSILNSQAANRELLGVLIQDNFNLKEENNRLRERILDVERSLSQGRQEEEWRRESIRQELDAKISAAQKIAGEAMMAAQSVDTPEIKAVKGKAGCLASLLGLDGDIQVVAMPRRRKPHPLETRPGGAAAAAPPPPAYPKPTRPPE